MESVHSLLNQDKFLKNIDSIFDFVDKVKEDRKTITKTASTDIDMIDKYINGDDITVNVPLNKIIESKKKLFSVEDYINSDNIDNNEVEVNVYQKYPNAGFIILVETDDIDLIEENIVIISREIKDPHYDVKISRVKMRKNDENIFVVSFLLKENYLGRYLISRNLYFLEGNSKKSKDVLEEVVNFVKVIRNDYYSEEFDSIHIPTLLQNFIMKKTGDFDFKNESQIGSTVHNKHINEASVYEWFNKKKEKTDERRYELWYDDLYDDEGGDGGRR